jgi:hypothetical protein
MHRESPTSEPGASSGSRKIDEKWNDHFAMITRGFWEEFNLRLPRNAWALYVALATFYSNRQARAFPKSEELYTVCPLSVFSRSRAMFRLIDEGLIEVWGERIKRRRRTFYRFPHVDAKGHHMAQVQQPTAQELLEQKQKGTLPPDFGWVETAYLKSHRRVEEPCQLS